MNKAIKILGAFIMTITLSLLFGSCQKEKPVDNGQTSEVKMIEISAVAAYESQTKTYLSLGEDGKYKVKWSENENEAVAVLEEAAYSSGSRIVTRANSEKGKAGANNTMSFTVSFPKRSDAQFGYHAVYPSKALPEKASYSLSRVEVNLSNVQQPTADSFGPEADILISDRLENETQNAGGNGLMFTFTRPIAIGEMNITNLRNDDPISRITFTAGTSDKKINITGKTYYNLKNGTVERREDGSRKYGTDNTIVLEYPSELVVSGGAAKAYFTSWPFTISGKQNQSFSIKVETESKIYTRTFTLSGDNVLRFIGGQLTTFSVSLAKADVEDKSYKSVLPGEIEEGVFVVSAGDKMMAVGENQNYFNVKPVITEQNNDGKLIVKEESLSAAWNIKFDNSKNTYKISSISEPEKYVYGAQDGNTLKLVDSKDATEFSIIENNGIYNITVGSSNRYIVGSSDKFSMQFRNDLTNVDLKLLPAEVSPIIKVQETAGIKTEGGTIEVPVSYFSVATTTVEVSTDAKWLAAILSDDCSVIKITADQNDGGPRSATVKVYSGEDVFKNVKVTQYGAAIYHAFLDATELKDARTNGDWKDNIDFTHTQTNGAVWNLQCKTNNVAAYFQLDNGGYIALPKLAEAIKTVTVNMYDTNFSGQIYLANGEATCSNVENFGSSRYVLTVKGDVNKDSRISLKASKMFKIKSIEVETRDPLETPDKNSFTVNGKTLSWEAVDNAVAYDVTVGTTTANVTTNSYEFKGEDEWYDVTIVAKAAPASTLYIDSAPSGSANLKFGTPKLQAPVITVEGMTATTLKVKWAAVEKANSYEYTISGGESATITDSGNEYYGAQFSDLTGGESYTVKVTAKHADENVYKASSASIEVTLPNVKLDGDGSVNTPYTVKDINTLSDNGLLNLAGKYVKGKVTGTPVLNGDKTMTYTITDDTKETWDVKGKDLGNAGFSSVDDLPVGSEVKIYYTTDNTINYLYSINGNTSILTGIKVVSGQTTFDNGAYFVEPEVKGTYRGKADETVTGCTFKIGENEITTSSELTTAGSHTVTVSKDGFKCSYKITVKAEGKVTYTHNFNTGVVDKSLKSNEDGGITTTLTNFIYKADSASGFVKTNGNVGTITTTPIKEKISRIKLYSNNYTDNDNTGIAVKVLVNGIEKGSGTISVKGDCIIDFVNTEANAVYQLSFAESANRVCIRYIIYTNEK